MIDKLMSRRCLIEAAAGALFGGAGGAAGAAGVTVMPAPGGVGVAAAGSTTTGMGKSRRWRVPPEVRMTWSTSICSITARRWRSR